MEEFFGAWIQVVILVVEYTEKIPLLNLSELNTEHNLLGYEAMVRKALDAVVPVQLAHAHKP